jgi:two-component system sensor histidine kinase UhpB
LLIIVILIEIAAAFVGGGVMVLNARSSTRAEIDASYKLAELLVEQTVRLAHDDTSTQQVLEHLPLHLRFLRHVRISVRDEADVPITRDGAADGQADRSATGRAPAPGWFYALIAPPIESRVVPVVAKGRRIGSVLIVSAPADEITEAWERAVALAWVAVPVNAVVVGALFFLFGRALAPLTGLARGLLDLERRKYKVRLPAPTVREFVALTNRFNALAEALEGARAENVGLWNRLISAQDDERRRTASELHDEVGPTLFGLKANATSLANVLGHDTAQARGVALERVHEMLAIIEHLQVINRSLLNRLRPMALGHIPLHDLVAQMVRDRAREHPHIAFAFSAPSLAHSYGDSIDLTIYRCVQESLTNAIRHAHPTTVSVVIGEREPGDASAADVLRRLEVCVTDDGCGIAKEAPTGFGLRGMRERVQAVGGDFSVGPEGPGGTAVRVAIPIGARPTACADDTNHCGMRE